MATTEHIFSYGTLQEESVQLANFGRKLDGAKDVLIGYTVTDVEITDKRVLVESGKKIHPGLTYTGNPDDKVAGMVFAITPQELIQADDYEVSDYHRILAELQSGLQAWVYVLTSGTE